MLEQRIILIKHATAYIVALCSSERKISFSLYIEYLSALKKYHLITDYMPHFATMPLLHRVFIYHIVILMISLNP